MKCFKTWAGLGLAGVLLGLGAGRVQGACAGCVDFQAGVSWGVAADEWLHEASGLASSARNGGVVWTHNDGGGTSIHALSTNGVLLGAFPLPQTIADIEDIAVGPGPLPGVSYLYVGDIGGDVKTNTVRSTIGILRVPEPEVLLGAAGAGVRDFEGLESFTLSYPDGAHDAETLLVDPLSGDVFVLTKEPYAARIYRASLPGAGGGAEIPLSFSGTAAFPRASGGDISADGRQIVIRREEAAAVWTRCPSESVAEALGRPGASIPVIGPPEEPNGEGIALMRDGSGYMTISEGLSPALYFFQAACPAAPVFTRGLSNQTTLAGGSATFTAYAAGYPQPVYSWWFEGAALAGQTNASLALTGVQNGQAGRYEIVASNSTGMAASSAVLWVRPKPDLRITEVESNPSGGSATADWWELTSFESEPVTLTGWRFNDSEGGLADPFVIDTNLTIHPGESVVFVEGLTPAQFRAWWGGDTVPASVQVVTYRGPGLGLGASGDGVRLWNNTTTFEADTIASVNFGAATAGVSFNYDPQTGVFGAKSVLGVNGVWRAVRGSDLGSPGAILPPLARPLLRASSAAGKLRIDFDAAASRRYWLELSEDLGAAVWSATGDSCQSATNSRAFFEKEIRATVRFYRVGAR